MRRPPAPELGSRDATEFIRGLLPVTGRMVVLLDVDRLIGCRLPGAVLEQAQSAPTAIAA
jgi:chemotaxis signal transduction protein